MITESDRVAEAINHGAVLWPELANDRGALLKELLEIGISEVARTLAEQEASKLQAIAAAANGLDGVWPQDWRVELRSEWPA